MCSSDLQSVDYFLSLVEPPLQWTGEQRKRESDSYLANTLLPNSERVEKLVRDITVRDEREVEESERRLQAGYLGLQKQMVFVSLSALLGGVAAAFLSARRITRLQREAEFRYEQVEQSRKQLENLSSQLVAAQEEERRKLSRELHDQLGQTMSALVTELGRLEHDSGAIPAEVRERAGAARKIAEENVRSIRDTALLLRPSMLDDLGLVPALRWQAREIRRNSSLKVRVLADEAGDDLPDAYKTCIYRVAQEALRNCVQHAKATEARVVLQYTAEGLSVSVQDDGVGFDPNGDTGVGILGMEERVSRLGGTLKIESSRGRGTILSMLFPDLRR